jgi:hypothetical protein
MNRREQPDAGTQRTEPPSSGEVSAQSSLIGPAAESSRFSPRSSKSLERSVELHIEELVLHGFAPGDCYLVGEAVERELTRLFTEQGTPPAITQDGEIEHVDGGSFEIIAGSNAATIGRQLAREIYGGFSQ